MFNRRSYKNIKLKMAGMSSFMRLKLNSMQDLMTSLLTSNLVALYQSCNKLQDAVLHVQEAEKKIPLETSLEWCFCVVKTLEVFNHLLILS